jgi:cytochrome c biogenesis factor
MLFLLVAGLFCVIAPTWMICAAGMGDLEDETALQWVVRVLGMLLVGLALYVMFVRH